jgi:prophage antirepressor-like protein
MMTIEQLSDCLGYASKSGLENILVRNSYLKTEEFSVTHKLWASDGKHYNTRLFTEDGIYEVTFLAKTKQAQKFRAWVRNILKQLRTGELQLSSGNTTLTPYYFEETLKQLIGITEKFNKRQNDVENSLLYIKQLLEKQGVSNAPIPQPIPKNSEWKTQAVLNVKELLSKNPSKYKSFNNILSKIYIQMRNVYGVVFEQEQKDYNDQYNTTGRQTGLTIVDNNEQLKSLFNNLLSDMIEESNKIAKIDVIKESVKPLAEKYNDKSLGKGLTLRKVYAHMNSNWYYYNKKYKLSTGKTTKPTKLKLIEGSDRLTNKFYKSVKALLETE